VVEFLDSVCEVAVVGLVGVVVGFVKLGIGVIAVADEEFARAFGADVLQAHEVGEHRHIWGVGPSVLIGAVISAIGLLVTYLWAPETANISLTKSSSVKQASPPPPTPATGAVPAPS
jgi:hypothetical protein